MALARDSELGREETEREREKRELTTKAKEITPIASKNPDSRIVHLSFGSPFNVSSTPGPLTATLTTMTTILYSRITLHVSVFEPIWREEHETCAPDESECRSMTQFLYIPIQTQRIRDSYGQEESDDLTRDQELDQSVNIISYH